jgi:superoxide dismutase, Fe-Mn family
MPHVLDPLPYPFAALEPVLDARTLEIHHDKHHAAYVSNLNKALEPHADLQKLSLVELISDLGRVPEGIRTTVRNNGGGHFAHNLYWRTMQKGGGGEPTGDLSRGIASTFGSFADFKAKLTQAAVGQFGSGWAWLYVKDGRLQVTGAPGHDCPEMSGGTSLLVVDVWEHAYYLTYQNRRADYVGAWWGLVDWARVAEGYRAAVA